MRQLKIIWHLFKMKLKRNMAFRFSFFNGFFVDSSMFIMQLVTFSAIYGNVDAIGGWDRGSTLLFVATFSMVNALNMFTFFFGLNTLADKIKSGGMDTYLTKPMSPLLRISFESIDIGSLPLVVFSCVLIAYAIGETNVTVTFVNVFTYIALTLLMTLLWYDIMLLLRSVPFFLVSATSILRVEEALLDLAMKIPGAAFKGFFKLLFMLILPYGLMATVPVEAFTGMLTPWGLVYSLAVVAVFTFAALYVFRVGVRHYKSASS